MNQLILTCDPDFVSLALDELEKATSVKAGEHLDEGVYLVTIGETFWELAQRWMSKPPIFVRHICPVLETVPLNLDSSDIESIQKSLIENIAPFVDAEETFSIQSRTFGKLPFKRFDINTALSQAVTESTGAKLDVRKPTQIISVLCVGPDEQGGEDLQAAAYLGISLASQNLSDWAGGMRRFAREEGQISRSEFKLLEAIEVFNIELPPRGVALDLGASPGGWTRVLRQHEQYVTAIDPGELDPRVRADRSVRHKRIIAETYLESEPDTFDIVVNDMRIDARDSARLMNAYAPYIYIHGSALVTLKLPEQGREAIVDHALNILGQAYSIEGVRHLFHNRSEVTVYLKPHKKRYADES